MLLNGPESFTPHGSFLLGETPETRGLFLGCGMNSVGVATGGGAGMALAHALVHGSPPVDLSEADPARLAPSLGSVEALTARAPEVLGKHYEITYPARQWRTAREVKPTPLHAKWLEAGAHFGQVFDWERPLYFGKTSEPQMTFAKPDWFDQVGAEVRQAHERAAIFDQSTFGKIEVTGPHAAAFLNRVCANQMDRPPGRAIYTAMLNERGGIVSDLTAVRLADDRYRLYVGTTSIRCDMAWLRRHSEGFSITLSDRTDDFAVLGLMGPEAPAIAESIGAASLNDIGYFRAAPLQIGGIEVLAVRLSYVGEAGWEITVPAADAPRLYDLLYDAGARPAGTLAQTSMRIEKRFLALGHELDTDVSPLQAGLGFAVAWKTDFIGKQALELQRENGETNRIVSLILEDADAVPLGNEPVYCGGQIAGKTTSAAFGYRICKPVALADLSMAAAREPGARVEVDIAGRRFAARVCDGPVFDPQGGRMRQ